MLTSCSSLYCCSNPPALARVVARAEKKICGGGDWASRCGAHLAVSGSVKAWAFGSSEGTEGGWRRAMMSMLEMFEEVRRMERMCEPYETGN